MSRRPVAPRIVQSVGAGRRMAPGGRLWSESRIRPLWRPVGEAGESTLTQVVLRPTIIDVPAWDDPPYWNQAPGTGGVGSLADDSDSTVVHLREWASSSSHSSDLVIVRFGAVDVPSSFVPDSMYLILRAREVGTVPDVPGGPPGSHYYPYFTGDIAGDIAGDMWEPWYADMNWHTHYSPLSVPPMSSSFQNWDSRDNASAGDPMSITEIPSADAIRDGTIEGRFQVFTSGFSMENEVFMDLAEVTLVICSDGSGGFPTVTEGEPMSGRQRRAMREARDGRE